MLALMKGFGQEGGPPLEAFLFEESQALIQREGRAIVGLTLESHLIDLFFNHRLNCSLGELRACGTDGRSTQFILPPKVNQCKILAAISAMSSNKSCGHKTVSGSFEAARNEGLRRFTVRGNCCQQAFFTGLEAWAYMRDCLDRDCLAGRRCAAAVTLAVSFALAIAGAWDASSNQFGPTSGAFRAVSRTNAKLSLFFEDYNHAQVPPLQAFRTIVNLTHDYTDRLVINIAEVAQIWPWVQEQSVGKD